MGWEGRLTGDLLAAARALIWIGLRFGEVIRSPELELEPETA